MRVIFNPTGTHIKDGFLKVRVDLYPDPADKTYARHYVDKPDREPTEEELADPAKLALVPTHKELNPCLCHFIAVNEDIDGEKLQAYVGQLFTPDCLATLDEALVQPDAIHRVSPYLRDKPKMAAAKVQAPDRQALIAAANARLSGLEFGGEKGEPGTIEPLSIDIGAGAIYRGGYDAGDYSWVDKTNPADADGTLDTVQFYFLSQGDNVNTATFYEVSSNHLTARDHASIGTVAAGSQQTFTGLSISVNAGDYIGYYGAGSGVSHSRLECDGTGSGNWYTSGDQTSCNNKLFDWVASRASSMYGTGSESGGTTDKTSSDSGQGADGAATAAASIYGGETGSGVDVTAAAAANVTGSESGSGAEGTAMVAANVAGSETGAGVESAAVSSAVAVYADDSGAGMENASGRTAVLVGSEGGSGAESLGSRDFGAADAGTGTEGVAAGTASLVAGDAGQAAEYAYIPGLLETLFVVDAGSGLDSLQSLLVKGGHETGLRAGPGHVGLPHKEVKL